MQRLATRVVDDRDEGWDYRGEQVEGSWVRRGRIEDVFVPYPRPDLEHDVVWDLVSGGVPEHCWPNSLDDLEAS